MRNGRGETQDDPLISIITMNYNFARLLPETIEAIVSQDYRNIQYIVADDGSTDDSTEIVKRYQREDGRIELVELKVNQGACAAYAAAYERVRGDFVCSIDADDVPLPGKLRRQVEFFREHPEYDLCTTFVDVIDEQGSILPSPHFQSDWVNEVRDLNDLANWFRTNYVAHSAVMMRRAAHDAVGVLDREMVFAPDHDHFVRFVTAGYKFALLPEKLLQYRIHGNNNTHKNPSAAFVEVTYSFWRRIAPILVAERRFEELGDCLTNIVRHEQFALLSFAARMQLLAVLTTSPKNMRGYGDFLRAMEAADPFGGCMMEAALGHSPPAGEMRSMRTSTMHMWENIGWLQTQLFDQAETAAAEPPPSREKALHRWPWARAKS